MHLHASSLVVQPASFETGVTAQTAYEARQAAETRRRLAKAAAQTAAAPTDDETVLISHWMDSRHSQNEAQAQYQVTATGKDSELG